MTAGTLILCIIALIVVIFVISGVRIVSQSEARVIERLGKYHQTLNAGVNIIWPIIDKEREMYTRHVEKTFTDDIVVRFKHTRSIDLRETVIDFPKQNVITKDNVTTEINALLYYQIVDPHKAIYEIDNLPNAIEKLTQTTLRNVIGELELDETLTSRDTINAKLRAVLDDATNKWGVKVNRVELQDITPPDTVREAMEKQMQAERDRRAAIIASEAERDAKINVSVGERDAQVNAADADKKSAILRAEGEAQAKIVQAEAEAKAIELVAEAVAKTKTDPASYLLATKYIETLQEMTSGKDNKVVYMPFEGTSLLSSLGSIKEIFAK